MHFAQLLKDIDELIPDEDIEIDMVEGNHRGSLSSNVLESLLASGDEGLAAQIRNRGSAWTAEELSDILAISRKHIYKLAKANRMPSIRIGGAVRFDPHVTAKWLEGKSIG